LEASGILIYSTLGINVAKSRFLASTREAESLYSGFPPDKAFESTLKSFLMCISESAITHIRLEL